MINSVCRLKHPLNYLFVFVFILFTGGWLFYYFSRTEDEARLVNIKPGTTVPVSKIFEIRDNVTTICALQPYSNKIQDDEPKTTTKDNKFSLRELNKINEYLQKKQLRAREGEWIFIFLQKDGQLFTRSISRRHADFKISENSTGLCLPMNRAFVTSIARKKSSSLFSSQFLLTTEE